MAVKIASVKSGLNVHKTNYYVDKSYGGWVVIRADSAGKRERIAQAMEHALAKKYINYSKFNRKSLYNNVSGNSRGFDPANSTGTVTSPVYTDDTSLVRVCVCYAFATEIYSMQMKAISDFTTEDEVSVLTATKKFKAYEDAKYCKSSDYLLRGDILCTKYEGCTFVVLTDGPLTKDFEPINTCYPDCKTTWLVDKNKDGKFRTVRTAPVSRITIHVASGKWPTLQNALNCISSADYNATWHYAVDDQGNIGQFLSEKYRPWTSSNSQNDNRAITMEVSSESYSPYKVTDAALEGVIRLCQDICKRHNIRGVYYTGKLETSNLTLHRWFDRNRSCPGDYVVERMVYIQDRINNYLTGELGWALDPYTDPVENYGSHPGGTTESGGVSGFYAGAVLGYTNLSSEVLTKGRLYAHIATIDRFTTLTSDTEALKSQFTKNRISGVVLEAGYLYDSKHSKVLFKSPKFYDHMNAMTKMNVPYGLWMTCRARTTSEAKAEMEELRKCVQVSVVKLGVWLSLDFHDSSIPSDNDLILDVYREQLTLMGLAGKFGLYVSEEQLELVSWMDHCSDWLLWLVDRLDSTQELAELDGILTPKFWSSDPEDREGQKVEGSDTKTNKLDTDKIAINFGKPYPFPAMPVPL